MNLTRIAIALLALPLLAEEPRISEFNQLKLENEFLKSQLAELNLQLNVCQSPEVMKIRLRISEAKIKYEEAKAAADASRKAEDDKKRDAKKEDKK